MSFDQWTTVEDLRARRDEIKRTLAAMDAEWSGRKFSDDAAATWNELNTEYDEAGELIEEKERRTRRLHEFAQNPGATEPWRSPIESYPERTDRGLTEAPPHVLASREQGLRAIDRHRDTLSPEAGDRLERVVRNPRFEYEARYLAAIGDPAYRRAFGKMVADPAMGHLRFGPEEVAAVQRVSAVQAEARAMGTTTGPTGGFAIPLTLDPSIMLSSNGVLNPIRAISRVFTIPTKEWKGVSSDGVTAAYVAEATEATDASPTLAQPTITTVRGQCFVPFSAELGQDWAGLQDELLRLIADGKDVLESGSTGFLSGTGATNNQLVGLLAIGTTGSLTTAQRIQSDVAATLDVDDVWDLAGNVRNLRFAAGATMVGQGGMLDRIYRFTPSGSTTEPQAMPTREGPLCGYPKREWSSMVNTTTTGSKVLLLGDFSNYFIADRLGMTAELVPHLFGGTARYPTGQRGLFAWFRTGTVVAVANAFRYLEVL